jgi:hypothetical protein
MKGGLAMELDLDTFLTTVYCQVDDLYRAQVAPHKPVRPGRRPVLSDSEVLTLLVVGQWQQDRSERAFLRYARTHWRGYFPHLLSQSAFNRRARDLAGAALVLGQHLAQVAPAATAPPAAYQVLDGVPVALARVCRGRRHHCFAAEADVGRGGSDGERVFGVRLLTVVSPAGPITGWVIGPAATGERWLAEALLRWRQDPTAAAPTAAELASVLGPSHQPGGQRRGPTGPLAPTQAVGPPATVPYVADLGFAGTAWREHWQAANDATVLTKADYRSLPPVARAAWVRWFARLRQPIETVFSWLTERLGLQYPRARTYWGLLTRLAAKIAAFNLAVFLNHQGHHPTFAQFTPLG